MTNAFSFLQKIGKALMLPVAVLPVAGLLLGIGGRHFNIVPDSLGVLLGPAGVDQLRAIIDIVWTVMAQAGGAIFSNLPIFFAIGTALALAGNDGVAALGSVVGYFVMLATMGAVSKGLGFPVKSVLGMSTIDTGVFGGIAIGLVAASVFNRYKHLQLPEFLGFFGGKRAVPIITSAAAIALGTFLTFAWQPIGAGLQWFSEWAANENPAAAFTLYGFVERLMIPFGLHHIWNVPFFTEAGKYTDPVTGQVFTGEIARYIAGDPTAGNLAGGYLFKMFGLPAAALAMWRTARPENRARVGGIMISAALTSFITGITEPIEFSFLFVAPMLYAVHAAIAASGFFLCILLGIKHGATFSHGLVDFLVLYPQSHHALWLFVVGPIWGAIYFGVFTFAIRFFNLATPGREIESATAADAVVGAGSNKARELIAAFGGSENIVALDACITRLRVQVADQAQVSSERLKQLGASGVMMVSGGVQAVFGTASENLKGEMERELRGSGLAKPTARKPTLTPAAPLTPVTFMRTPELEARARSLRESLGGRANLRRLEAVALTRVRVEANDASRVRLNALGPVQEIRPGLYHLLVGESAPALAALMNE